MADEVKALWGQYLANLQRHPLRTKVRTKPVADVLCIFYPVGCRVRFVTQLDGVFVIESCEGLRIITCGVSSLDRWVADRFWLLGNLGPTSSMSPVRRVMRVGRMRGGAH